MLDDISDVEEKKRARCQRESKPPLGKDGTLQRKGEVLEEGSFYRVFKRESLKQAYQEDKEKPPIARRFHKNFFKDLQSNSSDGISVNCSSCQSDAQCSIAWLARPGFNSVLRLNLLNLKKWLNRSDIVVQYDPIDRNDCHYLLKTEDGDVQDLISDLQRAIATFEARFPSFEVASANKEVMEALRREFSENAFDFVIFDGLPVPH